MVKEKLTQSKRGKGGGGVAVITVYLTSQNYILVGLK